MAFASRKVSDQTAKSIQQSFSELVRAKVEREPVQNLLVNRFGLLHCDDTSIAGGTATRKTHPREPPVRVGRQWNG